MTTTQHELGEFVVSSGKIRATDPCYAVDVWCAGEHKALNGKWKAKLVMKDCGDWGNRVSKLIIHHEDYPKANPRQYHDQTYGVDSGQFGFFDGDYYAANQGGSFLDKESFYGHVCTVTNPMKKSVPGGIVRNNGVASCSGFGDGSYEVFRELNAEGTVVVALTAIFVDDEEDEQGELDLESVEE